MASEQRARQGIDNILISLGWRFEGNENNVLLENEAIQAFPELKRKKPDYVLLESESRRPLAIVEAKTDRKKFLKGLEQAKNYANAINAPLVFVSDGLSVIAKTSDDRFITRDGEIIYDFLKEQDILTFIKNGDISTPDTTISKQQDLIAKYNKAAKIIRDEGLDGLESLYEFCIILFIKIASETRIISRNYDWDSLVGKKGNSLKEHYSDTINYFREKYSGVFREINISKPETLEKIIALLDGINFTDTDIDIKGGVYEYFLSKYSANRKSALGQYFTPRHIVKMMVGLLSPDFEKKEKIYDPFCGTGGMLVQCYKEIYKSVDRQDEKVINFLKKDLLYGQDNSPSLAQIAKMNMILIGDGHNNIKRKDSVRSKPQREYDIVISNIPFNLESIEESIARNYYNTTETDANIICIKHCVESIAEGGRMAIIVPETIGYLDSYKYLRRYLANKGNIQAIVRLPRATFKQYTTAKTCIIYMTDIHVKKTKSFSLVEIENDGFSDGIWREPTNKNDIPAFLSKKDNLENEYPQKKLINDKEERFFSEGEAKLPDIEGVKLMDLIELKMDKVELSKDKIYYSPRLDSKKNIINKNGKGRLGANIRGSKVIIEPHDLVIGVYHTQNHNGLFAISDDYYFATSQIVAKIKKEVSPEWLVFMLRNLLPKLEKNDLTGREYYPPREILNIIIPYPPPPNFSQLIEKKSFYENEKKRMEEEIKEIESNILDDIGI